jgi:ATP-binding cassette subfamily C protein EexD
MTGTDLREALDACRSSFVSAGFFSLFINLLLLLPSVYMLQIYDRVLSSGSESTLLMLTLLAVFLFLVLGGLEWIRSQILIVTSARLDQRLGPRVHDAVFFHTLATGGKTASAQPIYDLNQLRQFLTGPGLFAFFDAPWLPVYLALMFLFHPVFGAVGVVSALILIGLAVWNETATRADLDRAGREGLEAGSIIQRNLRNAEVIEVMGMLPNLRRRWQDKQAAHLALQCRASGKAGLIAALSKTFRLTIQSLVLGLGAYLAIQKELTPGVMIAGSILLGRALAPVDLMISSWRGFLSARTAYQRVDRLLRDIPPRESPMPLPEPRGEIRLDKAVIVPPGAPAPVIKGASLLIEAGDLVAVIGPSAAGKSTLVRAILGLYRPVQGSVRLDGAELDQWDRVLLGRHIGYLPQDVELLDGTIAENIARFGTVDPEQVVEAARAVGIHEMILHLPDGYDTILSGNGNMLSAGQRQRLGLARALYGSPRLIVLDEPNSNLDQDGDAALVTLLGRLKASAQTVILVTHRGNVLEHVDKILMLVEGQVALFGPRQEVLAALARTAAQKGAGPVRPVPAMAGSAS